MNYFDRIPSSLYGKIFEFAEDADNRLPEVSRTFEEADYWASYILRYTTTQPEWKAYLKNIVGQESHAKRISKGTIWRCLHRQLLQSFSKLTAVSMSCTGMLWKGVHAPEGAHFAICGDSFRHTSASAITHIAPLTDEGILGFADGSLYFENHPPAPVFREHCPSPLTGLTWSAEGRLEAIWTNGVRRSWTIETGKMRESAVEEGPEVPYRPALSETAKQATEQLIEHVASAAKRQRRFRGSSCSYLTHVCAVVSLVSLALFWLRITSKGN